jgi:hypothetical protein
MRTLGYKSWQFSLGVSPQLTTVIACVLATAMVGIRASIGSARRRVNHIVPFRVVYTKVDVNWEEYRERRM